VAQPSLVGGPLRVGSLPEGGTQGRFGALENRRLENRTLLCQRFGAALLRIDRYQPC